MDPDMLDMEDGPFWELLSFAEAAEIWKIDQSTLRKAVKEGRLKPGIDCRKFGKQWVVTAAAMRRLYHGSWGPWNGYLTDLRTQKAKTPGEITVT